MKPCVEIQRNACIMTPALSSLCCLTGRERVRHDLADEGQANIADARLEAYTQRRSPWRQEHRHAEGARETFEYCSTVNFILDSGTKDKIALKDKWLVSRRTKLSWGLEGKTGRDSILDRRNNIHKAWKQNCRAHWESLMASNTVKKQWKINIQFLIQKTAEVGLACGCLADSQDEYCFAFGLLSSCNENNNNSSYFVSRILVFV